MTKKIKLLIQKLYNPVLVSLLIIFIFLFPHIYAWIFTPQGMVFTGQASWFDPWDINVYVAAIKWSQKFGLYFQNAYTTTPHKSIIIYPLYTLFGAIFKKTNPYLLFHLLKIPAGVFFVLIIRKMVGNFLETKKPFLITLLILLSGGFGWLTFQNINLPDMALTPFIFSSTLERPHEMIATGFYFLAIVSFFNSIKREKKRLTRISGISALITTIFYPYYLLSYYLIIGFYFLLNFRVDVKKAKKFLLWPVLITFPFGIVYSLYLTSGATFESVLSPINLPPPNFLYLLLGYGILTPFILYQLLFIKKDKKLLFLNLWFFTSILLAYSSFAFSKYYLRGLFLPGVLIALKSINHLSKDLRKTYLLILTFFLIPTSLVILLARIARTHTTTPSSFYYVSEDTMEAIKYLDKNTPAGSSVVVDSYEIANLLPAHSTNRVYFGHYFQTPDSEEKTKEIKKFYDGELTNSSAEKFLLLNNVEYVFINDNNSNNLTKNLEALPFLSKVYSKSKTSVYEVRPLY